MRRKGQLGIESEAQKGGAQGQQFNWNSTGENLVRKGEPDAIRDL